MSYNLKNRSFLKEIDFEPASSGTCSGSRRRSSSPGTPAPRPDS